MPSTVPNVLTTDICWFYAHHVVKVDNKDEGAYERNWPYQAIQVFKTAHYPTPPFKIDRAFINALKKTVMEIGYATISNSKSLATTEKMLGRIAEHLKKTPVRK
jgi:hypothetical protein